MKKLFLFSFLILGIFCSLQAQNSYIKDRLNIKIGYNHYPWMGDHIWPSAFSSKTYTPAGIVEANYGLLNFLETGAFLGFSMYERSYDTILDSLVHSSSFDLKPMIFYGVVVNLQLLPFVIKRDKCMFDLYISSKFGGIYFADKNKSYLDRKRSQIDYGIYGGVAMHPFKHWGLFYEYGFGNYVKWKTGVSLIF
jgi:hypothetical protein